MPLSNMSTDVQERLGRLDERLKHVVQLLELAQTSQNQQLQAINMTVSTLVKDTSDMKRDLEQCKGKINDLDESISKTGPALAEYTNLKQQVIGAKRLGWGIWVTLGFLLSAIMYIKGFFGSWESGA